MERDKRPGVITETNSSSGGPTGQPFGLLVSCASGVSVVSLAGRDEWLVGRAQECDIVIADGSVSREHARLVLGDAMALEDLGSRNGTSVQGRRLQPRERTAVSVGSVLELGSAMCLLQRAPITPGLRRAAANAALARLRPTRPDAADADEPIVCEPAMRNLYALLDVVAPSPLNVLILGETGVGKELYAKAVHRRSPRAAGRFLELDCGALPESILEAELFGYEKGAFTGAVQAKVGLFESAHAGTVFLDEVGELPLSTQAKLLRVLETGQVMRLGSVQPAVVDVRFVAATNRDLRHLITEGRFRPDLYFRLNGISITLPPLRQRRADLGPLAAHFASRAARSMGRSSPRLTDEALAAFERYEWPGNVRELRNIVERAVVMSRGEHLGLDDLIVAEPGAFGREGSSEDTVPPPLPAAQHSLQPMASSSTVVSGRFGTPPGADLRAELKTLERERILDTLARTAGNQTQAAKILGISRYTLINRLEEYGITRPRKRT
jgi:transcriptional regulator with GAF, ATPase, and Fis domain